MNKPDAAGAGRGAAAPNDQRGAIPMQGGPQLLAKLPVAVLIRITPTPEHRWQDQRVETLAVLPADAGTANNDPGGSSNTSDPNSSSPKNRGDADNDAASDGIRIVRHDGLSIELHADECESYYFNLMVDEPRCFVAYQQDEQGTLVPFVVTASYDLAVSYEEGDLRVDAVELDAGLHPYIEAFVLAHYAPEKKVKRERRNWSKE